jgi:hypothetical protein
MRARLFVSVILICVVTASTRLLADDAHDAAKQEARQAAESWLALVDSERYDDSWSAASSLFRKAVSQEQWQSAVRAARDPFGKVKTRALMSATYSTSLPGAPDGEYEMIQYETAFEHKQSAIETVTPMLDTDGRWHVSGYYVK